MNMPRQSRIDAPGALHHIIARGIERKKIFKDNFDRNNFLDRLGKIVHETGTRCYAWALIPNHFHLLLKTGTVPIATVMRRLLTGYAITHNRRHNRHGHLFQNRYKSILCQEDTYIKELVRYIHLNPLRAGLVSNLNKLKTYKYCGHSVIMGKIKRDWQHTDDLLSLFGKTVSTARRSYQSYVQNGIEFGKRTEFTGGGLLRSSGGWAALKSLRKAKIFYKSDERILGDSDFVDNVLSDAKEQFEKKYALKAANINLDKIAILSAKKVGIDPSDIFTKGKEQGKVRGRSLFCYLAARELDIPMTELCRKLQLSPAAISYSVLRGEKIAKEYGVSLLKDIN